MLSLPATHVALSRDPYCRHARPMLRFCVTHVAIFISSCCYLAQAMLWVCRTHAVCFFPSIIKCHIYSLERVEYCIIISIFKLRLEWSGRAFLVSRLTIWKFWFCLSFERIKWENWPKMFLVKITCHKQSSKWVEKYHRTAFSIKRL